MTRTAETMPALGTFIERYGLVQYTGRLGARYPREGACELGFCRWYHVTGPERALAHARRQLADLTAATSQLAARHAELLAWRPQTDSARRQRRRELDASRLRRRELTAETERLTARVIPAYETALERGATSGPVAIERVGRGAMLVFDHCHRHGWVRGLICMGCNNELALFEPEPRSAWAANAAGTLLALVTAYRAKCPDCREDASSAR